MNLRYMHGMVESNDLILGGGGKVSFRPNGTCDIFDSDCFNS